MSTDIFNIYYEPLKLTFYIFHMNSFVHKHICPYLQPNSLQCYLSLPVQNKILGFYFLLCRMVIFLIFCHQMSPWPFFLEGTCVQNLSVLCFIHRFYPCFLNQNVFFVSLFPSSFQSKETKVFLSPEQCSLHFSNVLYFGNSRSMGETCIKVIISTTFAFLIFLMNHFLEQLCHNDTLIFGSKFRVCGSLFFQSSRKPTLF